MKKFIKMMCCVLFVSSAAQAQDDWLKKGAFEPVKVEKEAPPQQETPKVEAPQVETLSVEPLRAIAPAEPVVEKEAPKRKKPKKKVTPQAQPAGQNLMFRKKEEVGHGTMFREKPAEKPAKKKVTDNALLISDQECQYLVPYQPKVDGDAEYKPDVDVHGKSVVGADLSPAVIQPPEKVSFDINVDLAKYMGIEVPDGVEGKAKMGTITVEKGQVKYNGKPLEGDAAAALKKLCAPRHKGKSPK